jgi:polysaccharide export outer membrane protein
MRNSILKYSFILALLVFISSCAVQKSRIFKIPRGTEYVFDTLSPETNKEYKIAVGDKISFSILTNNGETMFIKQSSNGSTGEYGNGEITVKYDSTAYLPLIGHIHLVGMTTAEAEEIFKREFSKFINDPYVRLSVSNARIVLFKGVGSTASIIPIPNNKTTILEVIAMSGGIPERGDAKTIKLVRKENGIRKIYLIDLSTIDKIENGDMLVQSNDYIYIESNINYVQELTKEFQQILTPISVIVTSITLYKTFVK